MSEEMKPWQTCYNCGGKGWHFELCPALTASRATPATPAGDEELPPLPEGAKAYEYTGNTIVYGAKEVRQAQREAYELGIKEGRVYQHKVSEKIIARRLGIAAPPPYTPQDGARCADEHRQFREGVEADLERIRRASMPPKEDGR